MPYSNFGRPPAEIKPRDVVSVVVPFSDFGAVGTADDTETIQKAIDWCASANGTEGTANVAVGQAGTFAVDGLVIKNGTRILCPGVTATKFVPVAAPVAAAAMLLDSGPVQQVELTGFMIDMASYPAQRAVYFRAVPVLIDAVMQGGLWYARFKDLFIRGCTEDSFWLHGAGDFTGPHQFLKFERVVVESASLARNALRMSGQVGQVDFDGACRFDGPGWHAGSVQPNILIQRTVDAAGVNNGDLAPYAIAFNGITSQSNTRIATIERAAGVTFSKCYFESAEEGIYNDVSAELTKVEKCVFANVGHNAGNTGWAVKTNNGVLVARDNLFRGQSDKHYVRVGGELVLEGTHIALYDADPGLRTTGVTLQLAVAAELVTDTFSTVFLNGPSATRITDIDSKLAPGSFITFVANGGYVVFGAGGNIDLSAWREPIVVAPDACITLVRNDLSGTWRVVSVSGPRGYSRPLPVFVNAAMSPFQISPFSGTIRVDASGGIVTLLLPSRADTPGGHRVHVKKIDSSTNVVRINGWTTAENPDGQADNTVRLVDQTQAMEFERNGVVGSGGWDTVASVSARTGAPGVGAVLSFGSYLLPAAGTYNGSTAVTLSVDADGTSAATPNTVVARGGSGEGFFRNYIQVRNASGFNTPLVGNALSAFGIGGPNDALFAAYGNIYFCPGNAITVSVSMYGSDLSTEFIGPVRAYGMESLDSVPVSISVRRGTGRATYIGYDTSGDYGFIAAVHMGTNWKTLILNPIGGGVAVGPDIGGGQQLRVNGNVRANGYIKSDIRLYAGSAGSGTGGQSVFTDDGGTDRWGIGIPGTAGGRAFFLYDVVNARFILDVSETTGKAKFYLSLDVAGALTVTGTASSFFTTSGGIIGLVIADVTSNTGINLLPASSGNTAFVDVGRIGANMSFRTSSSSYGDRTWLSVTAGGVTTFGYAALFNAVITVLTATSAYALQFEDTAGNTGMAFKPANAGSSAFFDCVRIGSGIIFRVSNASGADRTWLSVNSAGTATFGFTVVVSGSLSVSGTATIGTLSVTVVSSNLLPSAGGLDIGGGANKWRDYYSTGKIECGTTLRTGAPSGGTSNAWRLGDYITGSYSVNFTAAVEVEIGGALRKLAVLN